VVNFWAPPKTADEGGKTRDSVKMMEVLMLTFRGGSAKQLKCVLYMSSLVSIKTFHFLQPCLPSFERIIEEFRLTVTFFKPFNFTSLKASHFVLVALA
jgi:hypothetical protein